MAGENSFIKVLDKIEFAKLSLESRITCVRRLYQDANLEEAYKAALQLEEISEGLVLFARRLPAYTGCPMAETDVENCMAECIPVEMGFTIEGWFALRIPALLPKKSSGSADYIRSFLYPAMRRFFQAQPPVRYRDCVLVYRHVYDRDMPDRQKRDHDNIEVNMVSDIVAMYVMPDDSPAVCSHYYCSAEGTENRTEVYVVPKWDFPIWLVKETGMPDKGVELYEKR
ncbi:DUF6100 family protein [Lachnospiraceae bacterium 45-W7]